MQSHVKFIISAIIGFHILYWFLMKTIKNEDIDVLVTHGETCFHVFQQKNNNRKKTFAVMLPPFFSFLNKPISRNKLNNRGNICLRILFESEQGIVKSKTEKSSL